MVLLEDGLVLFLDFSEGAPDMSTVSKVMDKSSCQNHGTPNGAIIIKPYEDMSNDSDDEGDELYVIYDDDETFWTAGVAQVTLSEETTIVKKGSSSLKIVRVGGAASDLVAFHNYGVAEDWSQYDLISFWWYGNNTGEIVKVHIQDGAGAWFQYHITDDYTGWRRIIYGLEHYSANNGALDFTNITSIRIYVTRIGVDTGTWYFDRIIVDVGNWRFGEASDFDGSNDYIEVADDQSLNPPEFSLFIWIQADSWLNAHSNPYNSIVAKEAANQGYALLVKSNGKLAIYLGKGGAYINYDGSGSHTLTTGTWYLIGFTWRRPTLIGYVNGEIDYVVTDDNNVVHSTNVLRISDSPYASNRYLNGIIDEVRIYNRALTSEEVIMLYKQASRRDG